MLELGDSSERLHRSLGVEVAGSGVDVLVTVGQGGALVAEAVPIVADQKAALLRTDGEVGRLRVEAAELRGALLAAADRWDDQIAHVGSRAYGAALTTCAADLRALLGPGKGGA